MATQEPQTLKNGLKIVGEAIAPGGSLLLDGRLQEGAIHFAAGLGARLLLGPPGFLVSLAIRANSYSRSVTDKHLLDHFVADSDPAGDSEPSKDVTEDVDAAEVEAKVEVTPSATHDDLKKIDGIGPKIAELLQANGVSTFEDLASTEVETLQALLDDAGSRYRLADPTTWPQQAALAAAGPQPAD